MRVYTLVLYIARYIVDAVIDDAVAWCIQYSYLNSDYKTDKYLQAGDVLTYTSVAV